MMVRRHVAKDGTVSYRAQVRVKGHPTVSVTRASERDARRDATRIEAEVRSGRARPRDAERRTLRELLAAYAADRMPELDPGTRKSRGPQLAWWDRVLGPYLLSIVTPTMIADALRTLDLADATRNRYLTGLSVVFDFGIKEAAWVESNPCARVRRRREEPNPYRHLENAAEVRAALDAWANSPNPLLYPAGMGYLLTGRRAKEQNALCWDEAGYRTALGGPYKPSGWVNWSAGSAVVPRPKNRTPLVYPIPGAVLGLWRTIPRIVGNPFLFASRSTRGPATLDRALSRAMSQAGVRLTWHGLRHTFGTLVGEAGGSNFDIMAGLGHKSLASASVYTHGRVEHVRVVQGRVAERVLGGST